MSQRNVCCFFLLIFYSHHCAIQDKDEDFYLQFICGLDSVEARRWMNATLVNMVDWDDPERTLKPLIDGGTEGEDLWLSISHILQASADKLV